MKHETDLTNINIYSMKYAFHLNDLAFYHILHTISPHYCIWQHFNCLTFNRVFIYLKLTEFSGF